jgi:hypothetical protein
MRAAFPLLNPPLYSRTLNVTPFFILVGLMIILFCPEKILLELARAFFCKRKSF